MKKINNLLLLFIAALVLITVVFASGQTISCRDTTVHKVKEVTSIVVTQVPYDSTYKICDTIAPTNKIVQAHYLNSISGWFQSANNQDAVIKWLLSNGDNRVYIYSVDGYIGSSSWDKWIIRFNDSCSAHNIETYFVWSNAATVTGRFNTFQKAQTRVSAKFDGLMNEGEPYNNTISYTAWWAFSRTVCNYAKANNIPSGVYVGWHDQRSSDSIVVMYDFINLHIYIQSANMGNAVYEYNYSKSRCAMFANSCVTMNRPYVNITTIFSDETAFAYNYYVANKLDCKAPYTAYVNGFNATQTGATALIKQKIKPIGLTTFTSSYSMKIKPVSGLSTSLARMIEPPKVRKRVTADGLGQPIVISETDSTIYKQTVVE